MITPSLIVPKKNRKRKVIKGTQEANLAKDNRGKQSRWVSWLEWVSNR